MAKGYILIGCILGLFDCLGNAGEGVCVDPPIHDTVILEVTPSGQVIDTIYIAGDTNGLEPEPPIRDQLLEWFHSKVGIRQIGNNRGPEIDQWNIDAGVPLESPWCGTFLGAGFREFDLPVPTGYAWSPSWFPRSRIIPYEEVQPGDVGGIYFQSLGRIAHVFVYDENPSRNSSFAFTIEGNTNDDGGRMGHSVMRKKRSPRKIHSSANWIESDKPP